MSHRRYHDAIGDEIAARDVVDARDDEPIAELSIDSWNPDPWTYDAVIDQLIVAFSDEMQSVEAPW